MDILKSQGGEDMNMKTMLNAQNNKRESKSSDVFKGMCFSFSQGIMTRAMKARAQTN
ncbi:MAG: hypothetical protein HY482_01200 [Candidatus Wildermuthbacteria bacterium]|nr:hypothetical protein [Candidatus Wildermuthbacteria bacterium]